MPALKMLIVDIPNTNKVNVQFFIPKGDPSCGKELMGLYVTSDYDILTTGKVGIVAEIEDGISGWYAEKADVDKLSSMKITGVVKYTTLNYPKTIRKIDPNKAIASILYLTSKV